MNKEKIAALLVVAIVFSLFFVRSEKADKIPHYSKTSVLTQGDDITCGIPENAAFTELIHVGIGSGGSEIGFEPGNECEAMGPEDFFVDGDTIAVLDSVNKKIKFFRGGSYERSIDISYMGYPYAMVKLGSHIYVQDYCLDNICKIDSETGELVEILPLPDGMTSCFSIGFSSDGNTVYLWDESYGMHDVLGLASPISYPLEIWEEENSVIYSTPFSSKEIAFENLRVMFLGYDRQGNAFFEVYDPIDACIVAGEVTIRKMSPAGELLGVARINTSDLIYYPERHIQVTAAGDIFCMMCDDCGISVFSVQLGKSYVSSKDSILLEIEAEDETSGMPRSTPIPAEEQISKKRNEVEATLSEIASFRWSIDEDNKYVRPNVTLPAWVANATPSPTENMVGMPYAWGRWSTVTYFLQKKVTSAPDGHLYTTGNVSSSKVSYTIGNDCAGYASRGYGFHTHYNTDLYANYYYNEIQESALRRMDYLSKKSGSDRHIIIFVSRDNTNLKYTIYDSSKAKGKATMRMVSQLLYTGFKTKTPWMPNCYSSSGTYYNNDLQHWQKCSECGIEFGHEDHTFVLTNGRYKCIYCGFEQPFKSPLGLKNESLQGEIR